MQEKAPTIRLQNATQNNLKGVTLEIPHHQLIVVTGVSGSGKSSLAFEVIAQEGQRRYLETFSSFSRQYLGKMGMPAVDSIEGLSPVITVGQKTRNANPRSTVGTLSDLYDHLRLLFARLGQSDSETEFSRSLFSFNHPKGACPICNGLGLEEKISLNKLIADPTKTLREGALAPTLPNGYTMYSQVTLEVMNRICEAHGFSVDIPWENLSDEQRDVILNGSTRLKVPFGKHSLESRLKWTGITVKPREEGYYKGMLPIMSDILRRDRNKNILRYAESLPCSECKGKRLNKAALSVRLQGKGIGELVELEVKDLGDWLKGLNWIGRNGKIAEAILEKMQDRIQLMEKLGVGHLSMERPAGSLSGGESQRIRLVNQVTAELSQVLYVFDEPSIGLHPADNQAMVEVMRTLVNQGNTVLVVEHDENTIRQADWIVDIGPEAGEQGGELIFSGPIDRFLPADLQGKSKTWEMLKRKNTEVSFPEGKEREWWTLDNFTRHNLKGFDARLLQKGFNVVSGLSGAGKSSFLQEVSERMEAALPMVRIDQNPIGRTPRSNPATYTGMATHIRDLFAKTEAAKAGGFSRSQFSFNNKGGRCETCEGAGRIQIGMHFLGQVDLLCGTCNGQRFKPEVLAVRFEDKNIYEVFEMSVLEALSFFEGHSKLHRQLSTLASIGLGYLRLGQPSTTLSGGEAQRIKLASSLHKPAVGNTLYLLDEPTVGLHLADVQVLLKALRQLTQKGNTILCIEHDLDVIRQADHILDLGPGRGAAGGHLVVQGTAQLVRETEHSLTGVAMRSEVGVPGTSVLKGLQGEILFKNVKTHSIKGVDVSIKRNALNVIAGVSGSGKSSFAFSTLFAEARSRFTESLSTYARSFLQNANPAVFDSVSGLGPAVAIGRRFLSHSPRSTVATLTGIHAHFRLLFSRVSQRKGEPLTARHFSFNHRTGACVTCNGLGFELTCDPQRLITNPQNSFWEGAMAGTKPGKFYGDANGQYLATLDEAAKEHRVEVHLPFSELSPEALKFVLYGTGEEEYEVVWHFKNKTRTGVQELKASWPGFCNYIDEEFQRKQGNKNINALRDLMHEVECHSCSGARLRPASLAVSWEGKSIAEWMKLTVDEMRHRLDSVKGGNADWKVVWEPMNRQLEILQELGLGYLGLNRSANNLSGGEAQRIRLAGQFAAHLYGVTYVLDEPTVGLHGADTASMLKVLRRLINRGNTVVVVEHDLEVVRAADHIVEFGPGAGANGGEVVVSGKHDDVKNCSRSATGRFLRLPKKALSWKRDAMGLKKDAFGLKGASLHNLKNIDLGFASGGLVAVCGPSGSGKSSLINGVLLASARAGKPLGCEETYGLDQFSEVLAVDQSPLANSSVSSPATWTGWMNHLRKAYAQSANGRAVAMKPSFFSYNHKDGRCPECLGYGQVKAALDFVGDVWMPCESCLGLRYQKEVLAVDWLEKNVGEVLQMTAEEASSHFSEHAKLKRIPQVLTEVGLGHLALGQPLNTLSGGEAQRLKLAKALFDPPKGSALYLMDEPGTGLHMEDLQTLVAVFHRLVEAGHSLIYIEHQPDLIALADQIVELGPVGGPSGGFLQSRD